MKKVNIIISLLILINASLSATNYISVKDGNWNDPSTWAPNGVPFTANGTSDEVVIYHQIQTEENISLSGASRLMIKNNGGLRSTQEIKFRGANTKMEIELGGTLICNKIVQEVSNSKIYNSGQIQFQTLSVANSAVFYNSGQLIGNVIEVSDAHFHCTEGMIELKENFLFENDAVIRMNQAEVNIAQQLLGEESATIYVNGGSMIESNQLALHSRASILGEGSGGTLLINEVLITSGFIACVDHSCRYEMGDEVPTTLELKGSAEGEEKGFTFDAEIDQNMVNLFWMTKTEKNNEYFTIEKSYDGLKWFIVARQDGAGDSDEELHYNFEDDVREAGGSTLYYRLRFTNHAGISIYSEVMIIYVPFFAETPRPEILSFPNPVIDHFQMRVKDVAMVKNIRLINAVGATMPILIHEQSDGFEVELPDHIAVGAYFLQMTENGELLTKKIIVTRF